jgi:hypothetical protein
MRELACIIVAMLWASGCNSSNANICCINYNGAQSYWRCPTATASSACCDTNDAGIPLCITTPMDPSANGCVDDASPSDCP